MKTDAFLTCLGFFGISTGASTALQGIYSFNSGTTGIIYNQLYTTGAHFNSGQVLANTFPLINVTNKILTGNVFSGVNCYRVGYQNTGNFSLLLDIESSGCVKRNTSLGKDAVLISTANNSTDFDSGFAITINDANHLVFKTLNKSYTINKELTLHDFVYVGLAEKRYVNFGIFNVAENQLYSKTISLSSPVLDTDDLYLGGFLNNVDSGNYASFYGKINQAVLFDDTVLASDITTCVSCSFATGYTTGTSVFTTSGLRITGVTFSGVQQGVIVGTSLQTGVVGKSDGSTVNIILSSGITGSIQTGEVALPLSTNVAISGTRSSLSFAYDTAYLASFSPYQVSFDLPLTSGDVVEIYTYSQQNSLVGKRLNSVNWPSDTGFIQLFGNGLAETSGIDYYVARNQISGFTDEDILSYDVLNTGTWVFDYSGYWNGSRIALSGGGYFPSAPQFYENTGNVDYSGKVIITGLSGICTGNPYYPTFGYDLYMNGQKLISGLQYNISGSGANSFAILLSGLNLPSFTATPLYSPTGGLPTGVDISSVDDSELTFIPQYSGFTSTLLFVNATSGTITNFSGFSEQIWVNGVRQVKDLDYVKFVPCAFATGISDLPEFANTIYNTDSDQIGLWGFEYPPKLTSISLVLDGASPLQFHGTWNPINLGSYTSGNFLEVWLKVNTGNYNLIATIGTDQLEYEDASFNLSSGSGTFKVRYRNNNIIGQFTESNLAII